MNQLKIFPFKKFPAKKFAVSLAELGLDKNDVVCMVQPNCPEYASLVTGAAARQASKLLKRNHVVNMWILILAPIR